MTPGPLAGDDAAEAEDDAALVLLEDLDGVEEVEDDDGGDEEQRDGHCVHSTSGRRESSGLSDCKAELFILWGGHPPVLLS